MGKLLTPHDIHAKRFHTHRLAEGYDMDEVDDFLEECEHTVAALAAYCAQLENLARHAGLRF